MSIWSRIERRLTDLAGDLLPDEVRAQIDSAREQVALGNSSDAIEILEAVLFERPEHLGALELLGMAELDRGEPLAAIAAFDRAIAVRSEVPDVWLARGQALMSLDRIDEALSAFRAALEHAAGDRDLLAVAYRELGIGYQRMNQPDKAVRELRKAVAEAPRDPEALTGLADALYRHPDISNEEAKKYLGWARETTAPAHAYWLSGQLALEDSQLDSAAAFFDEARKLAEVDRQLSSLVVAWIGLADVAQEKGDLEKASEHLDEALKLADDQINVHQRLAEVAKQRNDPQAALVHYDRALELGGGLDLAREALAVALLAQEPERIRGYGERIRLALPDDVLAQVAQAYSLANAGDHDAAIELLSELVKASDCAEAHLALGQWLHQKGQFAEAARAALAALRDRSEVNQNRSRQLLARSRCDEMGLGAVSEDAVDLDLVAGFTLLERLCRSRQQLSEFAAATSEAAFDFDRPLLVTVMGEFSSGKSTFVNAFIGAEVAPTGITPTTATINIARHGRERGGRLIFRDDRSEDIDWQSLFERLRSLDARAAAQINRVEIMLPLDILERVNLVDTPGLNSILPEHEQVARGFIARADAVIWVFSAAQAGKKSERLALDAIANEGVRVLGALNKIDQLSKDDLGTVLELVQTELGDRLEAIVPVSARRATLGEDGSNWDELKTALETHFFARANKLKSDAAKRKVQRILTQARGRSQARLDTLEATRAQVVAAAAVLREHANNFEESVVNAERRSISTELGTLYRDAAREVLELVLPRSLPFGSNKATPADRDYLISLLQSRLEAALARSRRRVGQRFRDMCAAGELAEREAVALLGLFGVGGQGAHLTLAIDDAIRWLDAVVYTSALSYLRGYLRGGYVEHFFRIDLPKIDLAEDAIYHALYRDSANVDALVAKPLTHAGSEAITQVSDRLDALARNLKALAIDVEEACLAPLAIVAQRFGLQ